MKEKIGIGIVTCGRKELFQKLLTSLEKCKDVIDRLYIVEDINPEGTGLYVRDVLRNTEWLKGFNWGCFYGTVNRGVGKSKNVALKDLLDDGCEHIFLIEDDMYIKDPDVFEKYIEASKETGIQHFMFGYHGPANKNGISGGKPCPRIVVNYKNCSIALNRHCVGAFCYYTRKSLDDVGFIDEKFENAFDHVSHSYELALKGYSTPYWWWADLANSTDYIEEQVCSEVSSSIKTPETMEKWRTNIQNSMVYFKEKYGVMPFGIDGVLDVGEEQVLKFLKNIKS